MNFKEKRKDLRLISFCNIFKQKQILGFLIDSSKGGMRLWVYKENELNIADRFTVDVEPPPSLKIDPFSITLQVVWQKPNKTHLLTEMGCQFRNINNQQAEQVNILLNWYIDY